MLVLPHKFDSARSPSPDYEGASLHLDHLGRSQSSLASVSEDPEVRAILSSVDHRRREAELLRQASRQRKSAAVNAGFSELFSDKS